MAQHESAKKRARQSLRRRARNRQLRGSVRGAIKSARAAAAEAPKDAAAVLRDAERLIRKAASKGVIPKKRASRQMARLAKRFRALQQP